MKFVALKFHRYLMGNEPEAMTLKVALLLRITVRFVGCDSIVGCASTVRIALLLTTEPPAFATITE